MIDREDYMDIQEVKTLRTVTEAKALVDLQKGRLDGPTAWMLVHMALETGLRVGELAALQTTDVDVKRKALKVTRLKKKKKTTETLAIGNGLVEHLREYLAWLKDCGRDSGGPLFYGKRGPLTRQGLQLMFKRCVKRASLPEEISVHACRHTLATHLLKKTRNLRHVQKQLGHSSPKVTANMYADVAFDDMQEALNGIYDEE